MAPDDNWEFPGLATQRLASQGFSKSSYGGEPAPLKSSLPISQVYLLGLYYSHNYKFSFKVMFLYFLGHEIFWECEKNIYFLFQEIYLQKHPYNLEYLLFL